MCQENFSLVLQRSLVVCKRYRVPCPACLQCEGDLWWIYLPPLSPTQTEIETLSPHQFGVQRCVSHPSKIVSEIAPSEFIPARKRWNTAIFHNFKQLLLLLLLSHANTVLSFFAFIILAFVQAFNVASYWSRTMVLTVNNSFLHSC